MNACKFVKSNSIIISNKFSTIGIGAGQPSRVDSCKIAVEKACVKAKSFGAKRAILLPVSAPFHCSLMAPAQENMINLISGLNIEKPIVPLISNVTSIPTQDIEEIRKNLINQITGRVRWRESILFMKKSGIQINSSQE